MFLILSLNPIAQVPRTCHNFLLLCQRKYYDNLIFHRLIKGFMVRR